MNKECENCKYYQLEPDMSGSSYYMCANKNYKSSWPELKGNCPYFEQISKQSKGENKWQIKS